MTTVATVNTRRGKATPSPVADVIGHQEAKTPQARRRIRDVLAGYDHYTASENWAASLMVSWRSDLYDVVPAAEWVPDLFGPKTPANVTVDGRGMSWLVVDAIAGVTPGRGWVLVLLREKATGALRFILNGHPIQSAWSKKPVMRRRVKIDGRWRWVGGKAWRREQWVRQFEVADRITRAILAAGRSLAALADWNRREVKLSGLVNPRLVTPAGIQAYDQILATPDLNPRNFRRAADTKLGSDHWPRAIDIGPNEEAPVPKPDFPRANADVQWFAAAYPGARIDPNVCVLHTTETSGWPGYGGGATAPSYTARPNFTGERLDWRQHFPETMSARALRNEAGGVETNTLNCVQVELVGTCAPGVRDQWVRAGLKQDVDFIFWPAAPDWALRDLADFLAHLHNTHDLKLQAPEFLPYPASYGDSTVRFTGAQWSRFYGVCGHQHVPENSHGDPGALNIEKVLRFALGDTYPTDPKPGKPNRVQRAHDLEEEIRADLRRVGKKFTELDDLLGEVNEDRTSVARWRTAVAEIADAIKTQRQKSRQEADKAPEK